MIPAFVFKSVCVKDDDVQRFFTKTVCICKFCAFIHCIQVSSTLDQKPTNFQVAVFRRQMQRILCSEKKTSVTKFKTNRNAAFFFKGACVVKDGVRVVRDVNGSWVRKQVVPNAFDVAVLCR